MTTKEMVELRQRADTSTTPNGSLGSQAKPKWIRGRGWLVRRALLTADILGLTVAFVLAELFATPGQAQGSYDLLSEAGLFIAGIPCWAVAAKLAGLYDRDEDRADHSTVDDIAGVVQLITLGTWIAYGFGHVLGIGDPQLRKAFIFWACAAVLIPLARAVARAICRRQAAYRQNTIIVGSGLVGQTVARKILQHPEYGIRLLGFVDTLPKRRVGDSPNLPLLGHPKQLPELIAQRRIERVIIAFPMESHERMLELIRALKDFYIQVDIVPRLFELVPPTSDFHTLEGMSLIGLPRLRLSQSSLILKRATDLAVAAGTLLIMSPVFALIAVLIKLDSRGSIFFRQMRIGRYDEPFEIVKFRTMSFDADTQKKQFAHLNRHANGDARMFKIPDDPRVTRVGRFMRRYSLDEFPQLWNVLKGDMSLVGPRPLIAEEDQFVDDWARLRLDLRPGITGLWQVSGRDAIPFGEMVRLDYMYVTTWSLWNDIRIMLRTISVLTKGEQTQPGGLQETTASS